MKFSIKTLFAVIFLVVSANANALECGDFTIRLKQIFQPRYGFTKERPLNQWLDWELYANHSQYRRDVGEVSVPFLEVKTDQVNLFVGNKNGSEILSQLRNGDHIKIFKHPFNTDATTPYFKQKAEGAMEGHLTASRSIFMELGDKNVSLKLPTNRPFRKKDPWWPWAGKQAERVKLEVAVERAPRFTQIIERLESTLGKDRPQITVIKDVLGIQDKVTGNGMIIRDLSELKPDHYYLPGQSIPFAGRSLEGPFLENMEKGYFKPRGKMDARLYLDYGIITDNPTPQNFLMEVGPNKIPTGKVLIRDLEDQRFSKIHIEHFQKNGVLKDLHVNEKDYASFLPTKQNGQHDILQNMDVSWDDRDMDHLLSLDEIERLYGIYVKSYVGEMNQLLKQDFKRMSDVETYLNTADGKKTIQNYLSKRYPAK